MVYYLSISLAIFCYYLFKFFQDSSTRKDDFISWLTLGATFILWPILLPMSSLELAQKPSSD